MSRFLVKLVRPLVAVVIVAVVAAGAGAYIYAKREWRAAQAAMTDNRYKDARENLRHCLWFWPSDPQVHLLMARAFRLSGDFENAESHLNDCLKIQRGASDEVQLEFYLMRVQRGEVDEIAPTLMDLVDAKHPETPMILETCAAAFMYNHRYRPALKCLDRWIVEVPNAARAFQWRGWVYEQMNYRHEAMKEYQQALQFDPELVPVRLRLAEMLLNEKQPLDSLPHLQRLRSQLPDRADVMARLGQCRFLQGKNEEARQLLTAAVEKLPDDPQLLLHLGKLELQDAHGEKAERWTRRAIKADPGDFEARFTLAACLKLQRRVKDADEAMKNALETRALLEKVNKMLRDEAETPSRDARTVHQIGEILLQIGQPRLALHWLHEALNRDPGFQPTHKLLADYYASQKDEQKAAIHRAQLRPSSGQSPADTPSPTKTRIGNREN